ncbi:Pycsar system effector family protein [Pseudomonas peli]|uniref:Pycsar system effector family protein n=1 Tax=Pseudomonas peli TaxID=592361 RepID=UPI003D31214D
MLNQVFNNTNDWLKFAEAKCATLLGGNIAVIFGIAQVSKDYQLNTFIQFFLVAAVAQLAASSIFLLISLIPSLEIMAFQPKQQKTENLIYFSSIVKFTPYEFVKALNKASFNTQKVTDYEIMLAEQIINNAKIAARKYAIFKAAIWLTTSALATPILAAFIFINRGHK